MLQPKWIMQGQLSNGDVITEEASPVQIAEMLGSQQLGTSVFATNFPTKPEVEKIGISEVTKRAEWN